jgi:hypothetical protein
MRRLSDRRAAVHRDNRACNAGRQAPDVIHWVGRRRCKRRPLYGQTGVIGHRLRPPGIVGQGSRVQLKLLGEKSDKRRGRTALNLQYLSERQAGVTEQGDL